MSHVYEGSSRNTFLIIEKKKREEHGLDHFMFVKYKYNSDAPKFPGQTALWSTVTSVAEQGWPHEYRTFVCSNEWLYVGQYRLAAAVPLSADEWKNQDELVSPVFVVSFLSIIGFSLEGKEHLVLKDTAESLVAIVYQGFHCFMERVGERTHQGGNRNQDS